MAFDNVPMTKPALLTAASALAAYDALTGRDHAAVCDVTDALAAIVRANLAKLTPKPAKAKGGFREDLLAALKMVCKLVERKNTIPIISTVKLDATGDHLAFTATDLDMQLTGVIDAPGIGSWTVCVGAHELAKVVAKGVGEVLLSPAGEKLEVMVGNALSSLPCLKPEDFPLMNRTPRAAFTIGSKPLADMLAFVRPAVSTEETRYYLNGVYLHQVFGGGQPRLRCVATDGHRMNVDDVEAPAGADAFAGVIVPRKAVDLVSAMLAGSESTEVRVSPEAISFRTERFLLLSKCVDGAFPDYTRVIPRSNDIVYDFDVKELLGAAQRVAAVSRETTAGIDMTFGSDKLTLSCKNMEQGAAEETVAAERDPAGDDDICIRFNGKYLAQAVALFGSGRAQIGMACASSPAMIVNREAPQRLCILMPLRR